jgi:hypothetical protein
MYLFAYFAKRFQSPSRWRVMMCGALIRPGDLGTSKIPRSNQSEGDRLLSFELNQLDALSTHLRGQYQRQHLKFSRIEVALY